MTSTREKIAALDDIRRGELTGRGDCERGATQALLLTRMLVQGRAVTAALATMSYHDWTYANAPADVTAAPTTLGWQPWHRADGLPLALWWELRTGRVRVRPGISPAPNGAGLQEFCPLGLHEAEYTIEAGRFLWGRPPALAWRIHRRVVLLAAPYWTDRLSRAARATR